MATGLQGIVIGGAASWLSGNIEQLANQRSPHAWGRVALAANHLFLALGVVLQQSGGTGALFSLAAKTVLVLTPFAMLNGFRGAPLNETHVRRDAHFFFIATAVCGVALIALGNIAGGVGILAMLAWEKSRRGEGTLVHRSLNGGCALLAGIGYAGWILSTGNIISRVALCATGLLGLASIFSHTGVEAGPPQDPHQPPPPYMPPRAATPVNAPAPTHVPEPYQPPNPPAVFHHPAPPPIVYMDLRGTPFTAPPPAGPRLQEHVGRGEIGRGGFSQWTAQLVASQLGLVYVLSTAPRSFSSSPGSSSAAACGPC